ncbi:MAG: hypothetical protein KDK70_28060 [Myxococcales bacterium]|nr:hypothetical protein [Myxococcales bacterium]
MLTTLGAAGPALAQPTAGSPAADAAAPGDGEATATKPATKPATKREAPGPSPAEPGETAAAESTAKAEPAAASGPAPSPPRIDGTYLGTTLFTGLGFVRVNDLPTDGAFAAFGATASIGQMVFPWLGLALHGGGGGGVRSEQSARQRLGEGYLGIQLKFVPAPKRLPLSLHTGFGFGGGAVRQAGVTNRAGFGGAQFGASVRYELFPWAKRRRPYRGGGFGLGPELGWLGFTPAAAGRPMSNVVYLALAMTFYFGS